MSTFQQILEFITNFGSITNIGVREIFCQGGGGGAVNLLPKKFSQVARILTKRTVEKKRGPHDATTEAALVYEGGSIL